MNRKMSSAGDVRVSVVVPFFNHGMVVEEALGSIRQQSLPVHQVVVVDDGSTDPFSLTLPSTTGDFSGAFVEGTALAIPAVAPGTAVTGPMAAGASSQRIRWNPAADRPPPSTLIPVDPEGDQTT
jgi:hypothetical protein